MITRQRLPGCASKMQSQGNLSGSVMTAKQELCGNDRGMNVTRHLGAICKVAAIGCLFGLASIASIDKASLLILRIGNKPVELVVWLAQKILGLSDGSTALLGWFGTA